MKTPWQFLRGAVQEKVKAPGRVAAAFNAWSFGNPDSQPLWRSSVGFGLPVLEDRRRD